MKIFFVLIFLLIAQTVQAESFQQWLDGYRQRAVQSGIPQTVIDTALAHAQFEPNIIAMDRKQPETQQTLQQYLDHTLTAKRIAQGREMLAHYQTILRQVDRESGVPAPILIALWGKETDYGGYTGNYNTIDALATLAYEGRRRTFFEQELLDTIYLTTRLGRSPRDIHGSWAGAVGQCQFMPSNYIKYGVDGNHDGRIDLWETMPDVFASMANLLDANGWQRGAGWGQSIRLPARFDKDLIGRDKQPQSSRFWEQRGVQFTQPVPSDGIRLYQPDGDGAAAYAIYPNFDVLMRWNHSGYFVTAVGKLADVVSSD